MFHNLIDKILHEEEEGGTGVLGQPNFEPITEKIHHEISKKDVITIIVIAVLAVLGGLYVIFFVTNPVNAGAENWYSDVYHHWQIAYLSEQIGFHQGFLRLWDLKGLEYFWGLMHPLVGAILIKITGSTSIILFRLISLFCGIVALIFFYLIVKRNWGYNSALAAGLIGLFNPVTIFNIASGMVEPMGIMFMMGGIYFIDILPWLSGLLLAFAAATRAEYWLLSALIVFVVLFFKYNLGKKLTFAVAYFLPVVIYMKYLSFYTGNPIYPVWWNYLGNAAGAWQAKVLPTMEQLFVQKIYIGLTVVAAAGLFWAVKNGKKTLPFLLFGFGNWFMWGVTIGITKYLLSYLPRFWVDRIMIWPYLFAAAMISAALFYYIPKIKHNILRAFAHSFSWIVVIFIIAFTQLLWIPIWHYYSLTIKSWENDKTMGQEVGNKIGKDGKVLTPEYWPPVTYALVNYGGIEGKRIVGEMFDPYFYMKEDAYKNWGENKKTILSWFKTNDIRYMFFNGSRKDYLELVRREEKYFEKLEYFSDWDIYIYKVDVDNINI